jgi:hypothetical protein
MRFLSFCQVNNLVSYEWQGKDLRDRECVRVASKGLTERPFCASVQLPPPRVFCKKRLQAVENKRQRLEKENQEAARVWDQRS